LRSLEVQYGLVPKLSHHGGKNHRAGALKNLNSFFAKTINLLT
jgi:hypothetical protein